MKKPVLLIISLFQFTICFCRFEINSIHDETKHTKIFIDVNLILSGTVTDLKTGLPLPGVSVYLADARIGAISDGKGVYFFKRFPQVII